MRDCWSSPRCSRLWEVGARLDDERLFLCPPSEAFLALGQLFGDPKIVYAIELTVFEVVSAFVIAVVTGLAIGLAVGLQTFTRGALLPVVLLLYAIPQATVLPLFVLTFGIGPAAKIAFGVSLGIFPVILATVAGVDNLRPGAADGGALDGREPPPDLQRDRVSRT